MASALASLPRSALRLGSRVKSALAGALLLGALAVSVPLLRLRAALLGRRKSVLYAGHAYYNKWYLSRALRQRGWRADVLNWDRGVESQMYYHGEDFRFTADGALWPELLFYLAALWRYDVYHFSNTHGITFGSLVRSWFAKFGEGAEIRLLKLAGKKIVYTNNGCLDGVAQSSFAKWGHELGQPPICSTCRWRTVPSVCSDDRNLAWGRFRNAMADYQCLLGGNRADYNDDPRVHEVPEVYCLDPEFWRPDLEVPEKYRLGFPPGTVKLFHGVGHFDSRTDATGANIKSSHIYLPLVKRLKAEGLPVELLLFSKVPNRELRFYQAQADIFLEMLTYGFYGANVREAMMLGKPVICYLREEWLDGMRKELPGFVEELPIVSATPDTVESVLRGLIADPARRAEIGARSRRFALKWHSAEAAGRRFDAIYSTLLKLG